MFLKCIFLFFNLLFVFIYCQEYNENLIKTAINISQSSYCIKNTNGCDCPTCDNDNIYETTSLIKGEFAIYGYNNFYDSIFVGFRGSSNVKNWLTNIHFSMIYPYDNNIGLEKGFYNLFESMKNEIYDNIDNISKKYNTQNLLITGHSLGGAISTLLSFDILCDNLPYKISLITFGSPRVGNQDFVDSFNKYNIYSKRITHYYDIVPHLPQEFLNYRHISQEIWYNQDNTEYKICNDLNNIEDQKCSNSCSPSSCTSTNDHMNYMNISMGSGGLC